MKTGKTLKKVLNGNEPTGPMTEQQSKSRSAETPRVQDEAIKMKIKKQEPISTNDMDRNRFKGSIFSREGKKKGESFYREMGEEKILKKIHMNEEGQPGYMQTVNKLTPRKKLNNYE